VEKQIGTFNTVATKLLEDKGTRLLSYHDMALRNVPLPIGTDPRVLAREGIRARQFIVDIPGDTPLKNLSQVELLKCFNGAMDRAGSELEEGSRKIRSVTKLTNKGFLGEFMHDKGTKWFTLQSHADSFITALGDGAIGALIKKKNHPMIAYYVPLSLNMDNPAHLA
jgi:hypothetical protein